MTYNYAYNGPEKNTARAVGLNISISTKTAIMLANFVRGKTVERAKRDLEFILNKKMAVPFTRFTEGAGHKPGMGPGKYPVKATKAFLATINNAEANALDKGLGENLVIIRATAQQGARQPRYGRHRGRQTKNTHIEIVLEEKELKEEVKKSLKTAKVVNEPTKKTESKTAEKTEKKEPAEKKSSSAKKESTKKPEEKGTPLKEVKGIGPARVEKLTEAGITTAEQLSQTDVKTLEQADIAEGTAKKLIKQAEKETEEKK